MLRDQGCVHLKAYLCMIKIDREKSAVLMEHFDYFFLLFCDSLRYIRKVSWACPHITP